MKTKVVKSTKYKGRDGILRTLPTMPGYCINYALKHNPFMSKDKNGTYCWNRTNK